MSDPIRTSTIGRPLVSAQDYLFEGEATPQNTNVVSAEKLLGRTQDQLEIVVNMATTGDLANTTVLTVEYGHAEISGGSITWLPAFISVTGTGAANELPAGELGRFVPSREYGPYGYVRITTDDAAATGTIDVVIEQTAK